MPPIPHILLKKKRKYIYKRGSNQYPQKENKMKLKKSARQPPSSSPLKRRQFPNNKKQSSPLHIIEEWGMVPLYLRNTHDLFITSVLVSLLTKILVEA